MLEYTLVLDLIRLAADRWLVRAAAARRDGTTVALEEILVCDGVPNIEAVIDLRGDQSFLVLRERHDPDHVLAERSVDAQPERLRVVWDASQWDVTRTKPMAKPRTNPSPGPVIPA